MQQHSSLLAATIINAIAWHQPPAVFSSFMPTIGPGPNRLLQILAIATTNTAMTTTVGGVLDSSDPAIATVEEDELVEPTLLSKEAPLDFIVQQLLSGKDAVMWRLQRRLISV